MSAKHPRFKPMTIDLHIDGHTYRARAYDVRATTPEQAVERVLHELYELNKHCQCSVIERLAEAAGMTARVLNGKIKCQWRDK